jgi:hypothetical protein
MLYKTRVSPTKDGIFGDDVAHAQENALGRARLRWSSQRPMRCVRGLMIVCNACDRAVHRKGRSLLSNWRATDSGIGHRAGFLPIPRWVTRGASRNFAARRSGSTSMTLELVSTLLASVSEAMGELRDGDTTGARMSETLTHSTSSLLTAAHDSILRRLVGHTVHT